jgi:RNA polymerase-binding transcription factor DksA
MFQFVASLFGCTHRHCTFPITARHAASARPAGKQSHTTYIVCLDCGKEIPYDWQKMKRAATATTNVA